MKQLLRYEAPTNTGVSLSSDLSPRDISVVEVEEVYGELVRSGAIFLKGIADEAAALKFAHRIGTIRPHRDSQPNGVTRVAPAPKGGVGLMGFSDEGLFPHTDRSVLSSPPCLLFLWCERAAERGGESLLVDGKRVYERLKRFNPAAFQSLTKSRSAVFASDGNYLPSAIFETIGDDRVRLRFRYDSLLYMTSELAEALPVFRGLVDATVMHFKLKAGQGYLVQNTRWLHGREPFQGDRQYGRIHLDPIIRHHRQLEGFSGTVHVRST